MAMARPMKRTRRGITTGKTLLTARSPKRETGSPMEAWPWRGDAAARKMTARQGKRKRKSPQLAAPREVFSVRRKTASETTASKNTRKNPRENERRPGEAELRERKKKPTERIASRTI